MNIAFALAKVVSKRVPPPRNIYDLGSRAFGCNWPDDFPEHHGVPEIIGFRGEWYSPIKPSLRVRLHNWLVRMGERNQDGDSS